MIPRLAERGEVLGCAFVVKIACAASVISSVGRTSSISSHDSISPVPTSTTASTTPFSGPGTIDDAHAPLDGVARLPLRERRLVGLVQHDAREQRAVGDATRRAQDLDRARDLVAGEHLERMRRVVSRRHLRHVHHSHRFGVAPFGQTGGCAITLVQPRTIVFGRRRDRAAGSCGDMQRLDLAVDGVGDVDVVRRGRRPAPIQIAATVHGSRPSASSSGCAHRLRASGYTAQIVASPAAR